MIALIVIIDIPYLMPSFINMHLVNHDLHLVMCITSPGFRTYMFVNNILLYSLIPFFLLLIFNLLLIALLARQKTQLHSLIQSDNCSSAANGTSAVGVATSVSQSMNALAKRDRQFKERTVLLILVTFFLLLTVSPRYITQMIFIVINYQNLFKITLMKCLIVLEMLNFSLNFLFYIICSKTSRTELNLILYYYFYWRWSKNAKKYVICNHPNHNRAALASAAEKANHHSASISQHHHQYIQSQPYPHPAHGHQHRLSNLSNHHPTSPNNQNDHEQPINNFRFFFLFCLLLICSVLEP